MMRNLQTCRALLAAAVLIACAGCAGAPGIPQASADVSRPDKQLDFHVLYKQNCAGCHGDNGRGGAAIPLNNPAYLAIAGAQNLRDVTAKGMSGTMMPPLAASSGGMLTDPQVDALVQGMLREWGHPSDFSSLVLPPYSDSTAGNPTDGQKVYTAACARCHGTEGSGIKTQSPAPSGQSAVTGHSIVDISYLALVNDQSLRSYVIAGHLDDNAPDWRSYLPNHALTPQEITDIVAWIAAHRAPAAEQSVNHPTSTPHTAASARLATKESQ